jgi:hypothetical protein
VRGHGPARGTPAAGKGNSLGEAGEALQEFPKLSEYRFRACHNTFTDRNGAYTGSRFLQTASFPDLGQKRMPIVNLCERRAG